MKKIFKCPLCHKRYRSIIRILVHLMWRHPIENPESATDLFPWPILTRRRGSNSMAVVVPDIHETNVAAAAAAAQPPREPAPGGSGGNGLVLALYEEYRANLRLNERIMSVRAAAARLYTCHKCGKVYTNGRALGGHKAQHTLSERRREKKRAAAPPATVVLYEPHPDQGGAQIRRYQCGGCDRVFSCGQGLGGHKQHCKGRPLLPPAQKFVHKFDLNELPPPEDGEVLALPWYNNNYGGGN